jgi:hypothetical protein
VANGTRTRDHRDHNPGLYQLSYRHLDVQRIATSGGAYWPPYSPQGPVAQWIERQASNLRAEVQFLPGPFASQLAQDEHRRKRILIAQRRLRGSLAAQNPRYLTIVTGVPSGKIRASLVMPALLIRMQPWLAFVPSEAGLFVPWMPICPGPPPKL